MNTRIALGSILLCFTLITMTSKSRAAELCGSKEGYINELASEFLIPDYFPPEVNILSNLVSKADYERCSKVEYVDLGSSCFEHDLCYDDRFPKEQCDKDLQANWVNKCKQTYYKLTRDHIMCRIACEAFIKIMSEAQRYDSQGFCPSCDAYNNIH